MQITYLGHAGFCAEDDRAIIVMDPWFSPRGAFDSAWFQFPPNHDVAAFVRERLADSSRERYLYISHEHRDHFDVDFLDSLRDRDFTLVVPRFRRATLLEKLAGYHCLGTAALTHRERIPLPNGWIQIHLDDSELNRDSAILVNMSGRTFFNMNDCKLFDRLDEVRTDGGEIDVFACQFSGATWHPTCYEYEEHRYAVIAKRKMFAKFETVARAIESLEPRMYVPSAGPPCFLDPELYHLNTQESNIFPRWEKIAEFLNWRLRRVTPEVTKLGPGGVIVVDDVPLVAQAGRLVEEDAHADVVRAYADARSNLFPPWNTAVSLEDVNATLERLKLEFSNKLGRLTLAERVTVPVYFRLRERCDMAVRIDFRTRVVTLTDESCESQFYELRAPTWQVRRVLDGEMTWEEFSLTFRVQIRREPDVYQPVLHAFLLLDAEDLTQWCSMLEAIASNRERITVTYEGKKYSVLRYCPHQGGDLAQGWIEDGCLVCPRHRWRYDLSRGGSCTTNDASIRAVVLEREPDRVAAASK
jgi:UDP-MurNAc hydroxylase